MPIMNGQNISPKDAESCKVVIIRGVMVIPISAGRVTAAGKELATPRPKPIADDHRRACDGINMQSAETMQHRVSLDAPWALGPRSSDRVYAITSQHVLKSNES